MQYLYPHIAKGLPLVSSFSQGYGNHYFSYGKVSLDFAVCNVKCFVGLGLCFLFNLFYSRDDKYRQDSI